MFKNKEFWYGIVLGVVLVSFVPSLNIKKRMGG